MIISSRNALLEILTVSFKLQLQIIDFYRSNIKINSMVIIYFFYSPLSLVYVVRLI